MRRAAALAVAGALCAAGPTAAQPIEGELATARRVSRAGAVLVSDDGVGALAGNPASLARQSRRRVEVGLAVRDQDATFRAAGADAAGSPTMRDCSAPALAPTALVAAAAGPFVIALAYADSVAARSLPAPVQNQGADDVRRLFPHRYGGTTTRVALRTLMLGVALRPTEWLGIGAAAHLADAEVEEQRTVWAGFAGRDAAFDPTRDLALALSARDRAVAGGALGVLVAPPDLPLELALAGRARTAIRASGEVGLTATPAGAGPTPVLERPRARVLLRAPLVLAAGLRYLGDRVTVEAGVELARFADAARAPRWRLGGVAVRDDSGQVGALAEVPSLLSQSSHVAARAAIDVEVAPGFVWLTCGYARARAATAGPRLAPAAGDLGGHTAAIGVEASWEGATVALGYARTFVRVHAVAEDASEVVLVNPFDPAQATAAAPGRFDASADSVALDLRLAWD